MSSPISPSPGTTGKFWNLTAMVVVVLTVGGSLFLSLGLGLKACPLCFYQRTLAMAVLGVLFTGWVADFRPPSTLALLALPLALGGLGVAAQHVRLELNESLECPEGIFGLGTAPKQSLFAFLVLTVLLCGAVACGWNSMNRRLLSSLVVLFLGVFITVGATYPGVNPPPRKTTKEEAEKKLEVCRPPFRE